MIERERKFLVKYLPKGILHKRPVKIMQKYLVLNQNEQLRIRLVFELTTGLSRAYMCHKTHFNKTDRYEIEFEIPKEKGLDLFNRSTSNIWLEKRRYVDDDGWEIDYYPHNDLTVAEFEYSDKKPFPDKLPEWLGEEITGMEEYSNIEMAKNFPKS